MSRFFLLPGMAKKLKIWNQRMLMVIDHRIEDGETQKDICDRIGIQRTNLPPIRQGIRGFTVEQIHAACRAYWINPSWIMGMSGQMKLKAEKSPLKALKDAVRNIEAELAGR